MVKLALRMGTVQMDFEILSFGRMMRHEIFLVAKLHGLQANYETSYLFSNPTVIRQTQDPKNSSKDSLPSMIPSWMNTLRGVHPNCIKTPGHLGPDWVSENTAGVMGPSDSLK